MRRISSSFILGSLLFLIHGVSAQDTDPPEAVFFRSTRDTHHLTFVFEGSYLPASRQLLSQLSLEALDHAERLLNLKLNDSTEIYFDSRKLFHNALTTVIPRDRIVVYTHTPDVDSSLTQSQDYLYETLLHEWVHFLSVSVRKGIFGKLRHVVGNLSTPNALWPRWIHEGMATWAESEYWGRARSGAVDFDVRKLRDYRARHQSSPLDSTLLDGRNDDASANFDGDIPYHFGYLIWRDWLQKHPQLSIKDFVTASSSSLGLSFRQSFRQLGTDIDQEFRGFLAEWQGRDARPAPLSPAIAEAKTIGGPYRGADASVAWVEYSRRQSPRIRVTRSAVPQNFAWPTRLGNPIRVASLSDNRDTVIAVLSNPEDEENILSFFDHGKIFCRLALGRATEFLWEDFDSLYWVEEEESGVSKIFHGTLDLESCDLVGDEELYSGDPFERVAYLRQNLSYGKIHFSQSVHRNSVCESNRSLDPEDELGHLHISLPNLQPIPCPRPEAQSCALAQWMSPEYTGPVLVEEQSRKLFFSKLPLATGSYRFALGEAGEIWLTQNYWDQDRLELYGLSQFQPFFPRAPTPTCFVTPQHHWLSEEKVRPYHPLLTLRPQFWIPTLEILPEGYWFGARTFFSDVREDYSGSATLSYDSAAHRPSLDALLNTPAPFGKAFWTESELRLSALPRRVEQQWQDRGVESATLIYEAGPWTNLGFVFESQILHKWGRRSGDLTAYQRLVPAFSAKVFSENDDSGDSEPLRPALLRDAFSLSGQWAWVRRLDSSHRMQWQKSLLPRSALLLQFDQAYSHARNFPINFYDWGGQFSMAPSPDNFLSRGFAPYQAPARSLLRAHGSTAFNLWDPAWAMRWNRFRLQSVDLRLIGESLTYDGLASSDEARVGNNYFSTLGAEMQFFGQTLGYVRYRISTGLFRGFGRGAETRAQVGLAGHLDL